MRIQKKLTQIKLTLIISNTYYQYIRNRLCLSTLETETVLKNARHSTRTLNSEYKVNIKSS